MKKSVATIFAATIFSASLFSFSACDTLFSDAPDYERWSENITEQTLLSNVSIEKRRTVLHGSAEISQGSGVIIYQDVTTYYALTNYHVVAAESSPLPTLDLRYRLYDCYDNEYALDVLYGDASYDLSVVAFSKSVDTALKTTTLASTNSKGMEPLAAVGQLEGRHNGVTFGKALRYESVEIGNADSEQSNVQFPALVHSAYTLSGSSGCAIIDENLRLVGVHYAYGYDTQGSFVEGYAIPVEKVREFLRTAEEETGKEFGV